MPLVFHQPVPALPGLRGDDARARWWLTRTHSRLICSPPIAIKKNWRRCDFLRAQGSELVGRRARLLWSTGLDPCVMLKLLFWVDSEAVSASVELCARLALRTGYCWNVERLSEKRRLLYMHALIYTLPHRYRGFWRPKKVSMPSAISTWKSKMMTSTWWGILKACGPLFSVYEISARHPFRAMGLCASCVVSMFWRVGKKWFTDWGYPELSCVCDASIFERKRDTLVWPWGCSARAVFHRRDCLCAARVPVFKPVCLSICLS